MFKACDGKLFETEQDCIYHEKYLHYKDIIYDIFGKYASSCKYPNILTDIPEFRQEDSRIHRRRPDCRPRNPHE